MDTQNPEIKSMIAQKYQHGFTTSIETEVAPKGLNEDTIRMISAKKEEPAFHLLGQNFSENMLLNFLELFFYELIDRLSSVV